MAAPAADHRGLQGAPALPHHPRLVSHRCARAAAAVVAPVLDRISPVFSPFSPRFFPVFCGFSLDGGAAALPAPRLPLPPCLAHAQR